ncbi:MAG: MIR domain-containing protein [bacterium]
MPEVRYGSEIILRHRLTGYFLSAPGVPYGHPQTSAQDQVTCVNTVNAKCLWIVKPPHGYPDDYLYGHPVGNGALIRLENRASRKNLHSHLNHPSPVSHQFEITCFGNNGVGDLNDNWKLEIEGNEILQTQLRLRLIHTLTNVALHSHTGASHPQWTSGQQEVTGFPLRDDNDYWIVETVYGPIVPLRLSTDGKAAPWISVFQVAASIASITGITLLFLGATLRTTSFVQLLSTLLASIFTLGILTTLTMLLLQMHRFLRLRLRFRGWILAMWMTCTPLGLGGSLYLWRVIFRFASSELEPLLRELFGLR